VKEKYVHKIRHFLFRTLLSSSKTSSMNIEVSAKQLSDGLQIINKTQKLHLHFYSIFPFRLEHLDYFTAISLFAHFINQSIVIKQLLLAQYILRQNQVR
jgi:hypothetical protein